MCRCCRRVRGDPYYQLLDELLMAVRRRFGNTVVVQFEDMTYDNASKLLNMYRCDAEAALPNGVECVLDQRVAQAGQLASHLLAGL